MRVSGWERAKSLSEGPNSPKRTANRRSADAIRLGFASQDLVYISKKVWCLPLTFFLRGLRGLSGKLPRISVYGLGFASGFATHLRLFRV